MKSFEGLQPGDLIRHISEAFPGTYVVTANYGSRVTAVRSVDMTNPREWVRVSLDPVPASSTTGNGDDVAR